MKKLIVYYGDTPQCVEGFAENCKRSCKGALHILPRKSTTITNDEFEHIKKSYKFMMKGLRVISEVKETETN